MEIASLVLEVISCLRDCSEGNREYRISICHPERLIRSLKRDTEKLREQRNDVKTRVENAERQQMRPRVQVEGWLRRVEELEAEIDMVVREGEREAQQRCFCNFSPKRLKSSYNLGKQVSKKLKAISELRTELSFVDVADMLPPPLVDEMPLEDTVGMDLNFREVWSYLCDQRVGIIGIYGMGGVGKTTLLRKINNELIGRVGQDFDVVIWAVVSRDLNMEKVQDTIGRKLGFPDERWSRMSQEEKSNSIFRVLKTKRFVLLLDDVWEHFDLLRRAVAFPLSSSYFSALFFFLSGSMFSPLNVVYSRVVATLTRDCYMLKSACTVVCC
ncbi:probable disease resistance protein At5g63020 [Durio zibethinus]|uniref:Probable disease resistance protein At5g63020 n=1 Tax=Durio zibethinus TaxID=66656 RepID=A0A6P5WHN2_DURZI|nr:probable disease resistance protein At5g63020 [Durio zibethinus]